MFNKIKWTNEEVELLKQEYPFTGTNLVKDKLPHNINAIRQKANELHLKSNRLYSFYGNWLFYHENPYRKMLSDTQLAYIAGIIDGEGWIRYNHSNAEIGFGNTDKQLIDWFVEHVPYACLLKCKLCGHWKQMWHWRLVANVKVKCLVELILPYMIVKRDKAEECLKIIEAKINELQR